MIYIISSLPAYIKNRKKPSIIMVPWPAIYNKILPSNTCQTCNFQKRFYFYFNLSYILIVTKQTIFFFWKASQQTCWMFKGNLLCMSLCGRLSQTKSLVFNVRDTLINTARSWIVEENCSVNQHDVTMHKILLRCACDVLNLRTSTTRGFMVVHVQLFWNFTVSINGLYLVGCL